MEDVEMTLLGEEVEIPRLHLGSLVSLHSVAFTENEVNEGGSWREKTGGEGSWREKQEGGINGREGQEGEKSERYEERGSGSEEGERWRKIKGRENTEKKRYEEEGSAREDGERWREIQERVNSEREKYEDGESGREEGERWREIQEGKNDWRKEGHSENNWILKHKEREKECKEAKEETQREAEKQKQDEDYDDSDDGDGSSTTDDNYDATSESYDSSNSSDRDRDSDRWSSLGCHSSRNQTEPVNSGGNSSDRDGGRRRSSGRRSSAGRSDSKSRNNNSNSERKNSSGYDSEKCRNSSGNDSKRRNSTRNDSKRRNSSRNGRQRGLRERRHFGGKGENGGYMTTDSDEDGDFDLIRTLRHYRPGRKMSSTCDSGCSCPSCASESDMSFFSSEEGPPGGEATPYRRAAIWLESVKYMLGLLVYGLVGVFGVFTLLGLWVYYRTRGDVGSEGEESATRILYWAGPMLAVMVVVVAVWQGLWWWLLKHGYGKGDQILDRRQVIRQAQMYGLVYTVRGAVYAPTQPDPRGGRHPARYEIVAYESEHDPDTYFDSDLEEDGQYRRSITPWREVTELEKRVRRNIYTRKAWFRDVPIVWWELQTRPTTDM